MVYRIYIIPISASQDTAGLFAERTRVGNIFDTARQGVILSRNTDGAVSRNTLMQEIDTFAKLDDTSYQRRNEGTSGIEKSYRAKTSTYTIVATDYLID